MSSTTSSAIRSSGAMRGAIAPITGMVVYGPSGVGSGSPDRPAARSAVRPPSDSPETASRVVSASTFAGSHWLMRSSTSAMSRMRAASDVS
ncbi:MAG: hypothetical protein KDC98_10295 [Planctomycetes bacterium]|nr:hypothetical protein [Planctomycetota bacterium]